MQKMRISNLVPRVLVVEDEAVAKLLAKSWLVSQDIKVDCADSYRQVRHLLSEHAYQLILMDIGLPCEDSGIDITAKLKSDWRTAKIPIVGITARASQNLHMQALKAGMDACYVKPLTKQVVDKICRVYGLVPEHVGVPTTDAWATA